MIRVRGRPKGWLFVTLAIGLLAVGNGPLFAMSSAVPCDTSRSAARAGGIREHPASREELSVRSLAFPAVADGRLEFEWNRGQLEATFGRGSLSHAERRAMSGTRLVKAGTDRHSRVPGSVAELPSNFSGKRVIILPTKRVASPSAMLAAEPTTVRTNCIVKRM
jgi:hypothetical protein